MISQKQLGLQSEKKFKNVSHICMLGDEEVSLIGFVNLQFGINEQSFIRPEPTEETELWNLINISS